MLKKILALFTVFSLLTIPSYAEDKSVNLKFADGSGDLEKIISENGCEKAYASSYDGKCARISADKGGVAAASVALPESNKNGIIAAQSIRSTASVKTQIALLGEEKSFVELEISGGRIKAKGKNGVVDLKSAGGSEWVHIQINADFDKGTCEIYIDGIKLGGTITAYDDVKKIGRISYSAYGRNAELSLDDVLLIPVKYSSSNKASGSEDGAARLAYYSLYKARYDCYTPPAENVIPGAVIFGTPTASSTADGYDVKNITDNDPNTKWMAHEAVDPEDYGKSLTLNKPETSEGSQLARYSFSPLKGTVEIEQDLLLSDVTSEKCLPYIMSPDEKYICDLVNLGGNFALAQSGAVFKQISSDTWYRFKFVIRTQEQTYDVYINGAPWLLGVGFREPCESVGILQYQIAPSAAGRFSLDNIKISYKSPLEAFETVVYSDDFESYAEGTDSLPGWTISHSTSGSVSVKSMGKLSEYKFSQFVDLGIGRESEFEGASFVLPDGISVKYDVLTSRKGGSYEIVLERHDAFYGGQQTVYFSPQRASNLRIVIYDAKDENGNTVHAQMSDLNIIRRHLFPVENAAFSAHVSVSGEASAAYDRRGINDNIVAEFGKTGVWQSGNEEDKWVELTWDEPQTVDSVVIYDTAILSEHTKAGTLVFDDGSTIEVKDIKNTGYPKTIDFAPKTVRSMRFDITDYEGEASLSEIQVFKAGEKPEMIEYLEPDEVIPLNERYFSRWINVNDVDGDGELEYIAARVHNDYNDNHYTASVGVHKKDGSLVWTWGDPENGTHVLGSDTPCQVADIDNDGQLEVLVSSQLYLHILDGKTGKEIKKFQLPTSEKYPDMWSSDTIILADISGKGYAGDIIVKNRYHDAWAYTSDWKLLWHVCDPDGAGIKIGHYPQPIDIDNDGRDEVIVGFQCIDDDGSTYWKMDLNEYPGNVGSGHKDNLSVVNFVLTGDVNSDGFIGQRDLDLLNMYIDGEITLTGNSLIAADTDGSGTIDRADAELLAKKLSGELLAFPNKGIPREEQRFVITPCGGGSNVIMINGYGERVWAMDDATHVETVDLVNLGLNDDPYQIITNDMNITGDNSSVTVIDLDGNVLTARYGFARNRQYNGINWLGEGEPEYLIMPSDNVVVDGQFNVRVKPLMPGRGFDTLGMPTYATGKVKYACDMNGDGRTDISILSHEGNSITVYNYFNKNGAKIADAPGRGYNISQY